MSSKSNTGSTIKHPYYPWDLKLKNYVPNDKSAQQILGSFAVVSVLLVIIAWILTGRRQEKFCFWRRVVLSWFFLCAFIHTVFEGYFAVFHAVLPSQTSYFGQAWKEYARSDSRYISSDTLIVCVESVTAVVDGPLAFLAFFAFLRGSAYRYSIQLLLSTFQLYGTVIYFLSEIKDGHIHGPSAKQNSALFCGYFVSLNLPWLVMPLALIVDSVQHMSGCQTVSDFYIDEYNRKQLIHQKAKKN